MRLSKNNAMRIYHHIYSNYSRTDAYLHNYINMGICLETKTFKRANVFMKYPLILAYHICNWIIFNLIKDRLNEKHKLD